MDLAKQWQKLAGPTAFLCFSDSKKIETPNFLEISSQINRDLKRFSSFFHNPTTIDDYLKVPKGQQGKAQWLTSRKCLLKTLESLEKTSKNPHPILTSMSHTKTASVAISLQPLLEDILGIGVDLENESRLVSPRAAEKFSAESEKALGLFPLEVWVIKEACFKATSFLEGAHISNYSLLDFSRSTGQGQARLPGQEKVTIDFALEKSSGHYVSFALAAKLEGLK